jgi:hypothetical protein
MFKEKSVMASPVYIAVPGIPSKSNTPSNQPHYKPESLHLTIYCDDSPVRVQRFNGGDKARLS